MLVLTRRIEESVIIDGDIEVTVLRVDRNGTVRLGFEAPEEVDIVREELLEKD
jgi:carbon storage regulator